MAIEVGQIEAIFRYPVKSMRGESLATAPLGWHGLRGDRRYALRRLDDPGGFPWLTASRLAELVRFAPQRNGGVADDDAPPSHVVTPDGAALPILGDALAADVGRRHGHAVQMMQLDSGIFDDATVSVITSHTVGEITRLAGAGQDPRRFRPNLLVRSARGIPFEEGEWLGGVLTFGDAEDAPTIAVTKHDVRCVMVNIDPADARMNHDVLKTVVRVNQTRAGIYATVTRAGALAVGQQVRFHR